MPSDSDIEEAIAQYSAAHPRAADSADGVRRCWLADPAVPLGDVQRALEALVTRGLLAVRRLPDGTAIYFSRATRPARD